MVVSILSCELIELPRGNERLGVPAGVTGIVMAFRTYRKRVGTFFVVALCGLVFILSHSAHRDLAVNENHPTKAHQANEREDEEQEGKRYKHIPKRSVVIAPTAHDVTKNFCSHG